MILLASTTRRTSVCDTSRSSPETATTARLFVLRICSPVMPTNTSPTCIPAMRSAFSVAASIDLIVSSKSTTTPLRIPIDGASPTPTISRPWGPSTATTAQVLVVPISRPQTVSCFIPIDHLVPQKTLTTIYCAHQRKNLLAVGTPRAILRPWRALFQLLEDKVANMLFTTCGG